LDELQQHLDRRGTRKTSGIRQPQLRRRLLEGGAALVLALACWMAFGPGSTVDQLSLEVPVTVGNMPAGYTLERVNPEVISVTVSGPRRELLLAQASDFHVTIDAPPPVLLKLGRRTFAVSVSHSTGLEVIEVEPGDVFLSVRRTPAASR
jgi:hypothetical protein